jgi:hypothetical protein
VTRLVLIGVILLWEFAMLEGGLRVLGGTESAPAFQSLFMPDDDIGFRLRPGASARYSTSEFSTELTINRQGVRDPVDIGPKAARERRVVLLGDSYVFAVQVPFAITVGERLEAKLNESDPAHVWRVINAGVQGYGPVEQWLFYRDVASTFAPDVVLAVVSVANDAIEAYDAKDKLALGRVPAGSQLERSQTLVRRVIRSSMVLQVARLRADQLRAHASVATSERPLAGYLEDPPAFVVEGFQLAARAFGNIAAHARRNGAQVGFILMPARFQTHDEDYLRVSATAERAGRKLIRHAATGRFTGVLKPLGVATADLLAVFGALDDPAGLHFVRNTHLSARGHQVAADAIFEFLAADLKLGPATSDSKVSATTSDAALLPANPR